jgi:hypothetical protein
MKEAVEMLFCQGYIKVHVAESHGGASILLFVRLALLCLAHAVTERYLRSPAVFTTQ